MRTLYLITAFLVVLTVSLLGFRGRTFTHPPMDVFPEWLFPGMKYQPKLTQQTESAFFADGRSDRVAPPGTVASSFGPAGQPLKTDPFLYQGKLADGSFARGFPPSLAVDRQLLLRGRDRFTIYCSPCHGAVVTHSTAIWLFTAFAIAFAAKAPIWPLHTWSPLTYAEAPTAGSIELSALLAKLGSYGLLRFAVGLFPLALADVRPVVLTLAVIGILYGSMLACVSKDLKRFVAYSSLAQMGFITLGVMSGSKIATVGAVLLMFNHGIITIGFFLIIGFIEQRRGSYQIADLHGLQGPAPVLAGVFTVVMLASIGLPGLSGFVSEYLILIGTFAVHAWWGVVGPLASWRRRSICSGPTSASFRDARWERTHRFPTRRPRNAGCSCRSWC